MPEAPGSQNTAKIAGSNLKEILENASINLWENVPWATVKEGLDGQSGNDESMYTFEEFKAAAKLKAMSLRFDRTITDLREEMQKADSVRRFGPSDIRNPVLLKLLDRYLKASYFQSLTIHS